MLKRKRQPSPPRRSTHRVQGHRAFRTTVETNSLETTLGTTPETTRGPPPEALEPSPEAPSTHGDDFGADPRGVTVNQILLEKTTHSR